MSDQDHKVKIVDEKSEDEQEQEHERELGSDKESNKEHCPSGEKCDCCNGKHDEEENREEDGSDMEFGHPGMMLECMSQMFRQQQGTMANVLGMFLMHDGKNACQYFAEIKKAIDTNSRCILKVNETLSSIASSTASSTASGKASTVSSSLPSKGK